MKSCARASLSWIPILLLLGCAGPVVQTLNKNAPLPENSDSAILSYAFAKGVLSVTAQYDKDKAFWISSDPNITALPDLNHVHKLTYQHAGLSTDQVEIQLSNGILQKISSTSNDQTIDTVKALNALLTQVGVAKPTLQKLMVKEILRGGEPSPPPSSDVSNCQDKFSVTQVVDITNRQLLDSPEIRLAGKCYITLKVEPPRLTRVFDVTGYPENQLDNPTEDFCDQAVCFRPTGAYTLNVTAQIFLNGKDKVAVTIKDEKGNPKEAKLNTTIQVLAPSGGTRIGFVRFNRRAFVENSTTLTFNSGMLTGFQSKNPSEIAGFFSLPTEVLKSVVLTVPLVK